MLPGRTGVLDCAQMGSLHRVAIAHTSADASAHDAPTPAAPAAPDRTGSDHTALNLSVRPVGLRDVPTVASFRPMQRFHLPDAQVLGYRLEIEDAKAGLPFLRGHRPAFVARSGDRAVGVAQFLALPPDQRWVLLGLGTSTGVYDSDPVIEALLGYAVRSAGLRGVKRLFARVPVGTPEAAALRLSGWHPYAQETVYQARGLPRRRSASPMRPQQRVDTWGVHQLYCAVTPREVQEAEALTSHRWDFANAPQRRGLRSRAWVADENHDIVAYAASTSRGGTHLIDLMVHTERRELAPDALDHAVANLPGPVRRVLVALRGYASELGPVLTDRGFAPALDQDLHLRYTTANVRVPAAETFPMTLEVRERLPQRVPTFMQGQPPEQAADS